MLDAKIYALRVTLRTVPGTVPEVVLEGVWKLVLRTTMPVVRAVNPTANLQAYPSGTDRLTGVGTPTVSCRPTRKAVAKATMKTVCRSTGTAVRRVTRTTILESR